MRKQSFRKRFEFWLDLWDEQQAELADLITDLKEQRLFVATIRDGLRLIRDLRAGSLAVLCELFPWVEKALVEAIEAAAKLSGDNSENGGTEAVLSKLETLQRAIEAQQPRGHYQAPASGPAPQLVSGNLSGLKPIAGADTELPPPGDDDDLGNLLEIKGVARDVDAGQNLINSMMRMQNLKSDAPSSRPSKRDYRKPLNPDELIEVRQTT